MMARADSSVSLASDSQCRIFTVYFERRQGRFLARTFRRLRFKKARDVLSDSSFSIKEISSPRGSVMSVISCGISKRYMVRRQGAFARFCRHHMRRPQFRWNRVSAIYLSRSNQERNELDLLTKIQFYFFKTF